ncbi:MAG: sigma 54-interacting transcriptional regulator [Porticoccaceae bacterium]
MSRNITMHRLFESIKKAARTDVSIYISGETGVGKELVARAIHAESNRTKQPFLAVNVANFSSDLIESQLFGHKKGVFTGAIANSTGLLQEAAKGTLFLDEVTCLPANTQAKLLRVLQERQYYPVGDVKLQKFNASIVSASNMSFEKAIEFHQFRKDLRYRLEVIPLKVPPLRDRRDDILLLFNYFLKLASRGKAWKIDTLLAKKLKQYSWPGNVRELENCARFAAAMATKDRLKIDDLPENIQKAFNIDMPVKRKKLTQRMIVSALKRNSSNRNKTAEFLGISRMTLWRKMKTYKLF